MEITFPDGTTVRASGLVERRADDPTRDFGLYMDDSWRPTWAAELIGWADFGVPAAPERAADQIARAYERAREGARVEIGCVGGLGRTGTVLACMAVLAGVAAADAVAWVRRNYDRRAVETPAQEGWVAWFAARAGTAGPEPA